MPADNTLQFPRSVVWEEVTVGAQLPQLSFPITWKTLAMAAAGTRDFFSYHHHPTYALDLGMRGAFVNTMFYQALFARFATDWSGPESSFVSLSLEMLDQLVQGDTAVLSGEVTAKVADPHRVELSLKMENHLGVVASSTVVLTMPSELGHAVSPSLVEDVLPDPNPAMPEEAKRWYGHEFVRHAAYPVSEAQIAYWAEAVQDANPLFTSSKYAAGSRYHGIIAPPVSLLTWLQPRATQQGAIPSHPDVDNPKQPAWPETASGSAWIDFQMDDATEQIVPRVTVECGEPYRPGDVGTMTSMIIDCSARKTTRVGDGYFLTIREIYTNQRGEINGKVTMDVFQYGIKT